MEEGRKGDEYQPRSFQMVVQGQLLAKRGRPRVVREPRGIQEEEYEGYSLAFKESKDNFY
jgi:hypothetical protein